MNQELKKYLDQQFSSLGLMTLGHSKGIVALTESIKAEFARIQSRFDQIDGRLDRIDDHLFNVQVSHLRKRIVWLEDKHRELKAQI